MEFSFEMRHTRQSFTALAHMQYDLFCRSNLITRTIIGFACVVTGATNLEEWWGVLLGVYGYYLISSKYASSNHTANKLAARLEAAGLPFPASRFCFYEDRMEIIPLQESPGEPDVLPYSEFFRLGEDLDYLYIFRSQYGGYMIPKESLGQEEGVFRRFLREKTGKAFQKKTAPIHRFFSEIRLFSDRRRDPPHL